MRLFELSFPHPDICSRTDLYYRADIPFDNGLHLAARQTVSFDTFFNAFSCAKYRQHTVVKNVRLVLDIEGDAKIELLHLSGDIKYRYCWAEKLSINRGAIELVPEDVPKNLLKITPVAEYCDGKTQRRKVALDFENYYSEGLVYFSVTANGNVTIFGGSFEAPDVTPLDVKIGLVICTYKREKYVRRNVTNICNYLKENPDLQDKLDIFVIDNGHTLEPTDIPEATLVQNRNLGGSGGFTRGMMEVCKHSQYTHVLLSDDDVVYQPSMFRKTISLLQTAKHPSELAVGAAMLRLDKPNVQHELGSLWNKKYLNQISLHRGFDISKRAAILKNEEAETPDYSAWWYMCMPTEKIRENGLPLPLFIKYDDIEYGARTKCEIVVMNGIGLWHESFEDKYSPYLDYYLLRNLLITNCLTKRTIGRKMFRWVITITSLHLVYQRYFTMKYLFAAVNDFLKGADFLLNTDGEALNKKLIASNLKMQTKQQLEEQGYNLEEFYLPGRKKTHFEVMSLNGYLIPSCFYKKQSRKYRVIDLRLCYPQQFYKVKRVVQYNPVTETGFVTKQKFGQLFVAGFHLVGLGFKMLFKYKKAAKSYRKNFRKLTSQSHWEELLGIEDKE